MDIISSSTELSDDHKIFIQAASRRYGPNSLKFASLLISIGKMRCYCHEYTTVLHLLGWALEIRIEILGSDSFSVANLRHNIGVVLVKRCERCVVISDRQRREDEREAFWQLSQSLQIRCSSDRVSHIDISETHFYLGIVLARQNQFESALWHHKASLEMRIKILGPENSLVAQNHHRIGSLHLCRADATNAVQSLKLAITIFKKEWGPDHEHAAEITHDLSKAFLASGEFDKAFDCAAEALRILQTVRQPDTMDSKVANTLITMGVIYCKRMEYDKAIDCFSKVKKKGQSCGIGSWSGEGDVIAALDELGHSFFSRLRHSDALNRYEEFARDLEQYKEVYHIKKAVLGKNHSSLMDTLMNMGRLHIQSEHRAMRWFSDFFGQRKGDGEVNGNIVLDNVTYLCHNNEEIIEPIKLPGILQNESRPACCSSSSVDNEKLDMMASVGVRNTGRLKWDYQEYELAVNEHVEDLLTDFTTIENMLESLEEDELIPSPAA
mmetsp:Transcript_47661/g.57705  ORF Transcript_47661/g.57705 Transcript_47661/m.57705 type:complete len:495 (-) Transcript_47661:443-1927(-)|eukprot:CAMPEP_0172506648 /NCGR_PEP_ID=MMETSP1066-20121228/196903_1 /TAXON_ID=671091 /ORGANISM="Coscinodiscus wailesii, Strain CCMP2513" /LENGTH=494 /DNA_ID=CAMNT_0013283765 /DNA_START=148 /DNA_END=1632 /DNA_ORIENTATION=-